MNSNAVQSVETLLVQARTQIVKYLPRHLDADKMIYVALETIRADSFLRQCEPVSIVQAVLEASQLGLMLGNKVGHAYLVPGRDKKANNILRCQLLIGYRGFIALAHRTGKVEAAVRDEYREMGIEEEQRALAAVADPQRGLPSPTGRAAPATKPAIREPQRKAQPVPQNGKPAAPTPSNGGAKAGSQDSDTTNGKDSTTALQAVVGPLEPDASGHTIRRTGKGVEYVVFKMGRNGSLTPVYSNQPGMVPEITRRQGHEAVARVAILRENGRQYYVLSGFTEG